MMIINLLGLLLIAWIVWWFWLYQPKQTQAQEDGLVITVENGTYTPSRIKVAADKAVDIQFLRKDQSPCAEMVLIPDLDISETLPMNKLTTIKLPAMSAGEYDFHCQMQMYRGKITVA